MVYFKKRANPEDFRKNLRQDNPPKTIRVDRKFYTYNFASDEQLEDCPIMAHLVLVGIVDDPDTFVEPGPTRLYRIKEDDE
jgi:hypothetical protein